MAGIPEMCPSCYRMLDEHTIRERRRCQDRAPIALPPRPNTPGGELRCKRCSAPLQRSGKRGRPPSYCASCKAAKALPVHHGR